MSNQVYSNPISRYNPPGAQSDILSLEPNNPAVPNVSPAYGSVQKDVPGTGTCVYWGALNGVVVPKSAGVSNYTVAQNPLTVPYWAFTNNDTILSGATLLRSKIDNVIAVNAVVPMNILAYQGTSPTTLALAIRIYNADMSIDRTVCYQGLQNGVYTGGLALTAPIPYHCSAVVSVKSGQSLGVVMLCSTVAWSAVGAKIDYKDFLSPQIVVSPPLTAQIQMPCICEFIKM